MYLLPEVVEDDVYVFSVWTYFRNSYELYSSIVILKYIAVQRLLFLKYLEPERIQLFLNSHKWN